MSAASVRVERYETIVVGGGQAGLAVGHHLAARDADFVILDAERRTGDAWRRGWDSLRLLAPARRCGLPGMPFPAPPGHRPHKDEVADYLERYAERCDLPVRLDTRVDRLARDGRRFTLRAGARRFEADNVVVATGPFQRPRVPDVAARLSPDLHQLHAGAYRRPSALPEGPALVVGAGDSGVQIALELAASRPVWLAGRAPGGLPRGLFAWTSPLARRLARAGVRRVGRVTDARGGLPVCEGLVVAPRVVVWCTGFAPDHAWIALPVFDAAGCPRHRRGVVAEAPGLYFVGLRAPHRAARAPLGPGDDPEHVARHVSARCDAACACAPG